MTFLYLVILPTVVILNAVGIVLFIFTSNKKPESKLTWILCFALLPLVGFIIYLYLGKTLSKKKLSLRKDEDETLRQKLINQEELLINSFHHDGLDGVDDKYKQLILMNLKHGKALATFNNDVEILIDGKKKFSRLIGDITSSKSEINFQYFIYKKSKIGDEIRKHLISKSKEGIKVRVLIDDFGSKNIPKGYFDELISSGGEVSVSLKMGRFFKHFNNRNHRKIVVIDRKIAYTGGYNIGDEYVEITKERGYWRDTHVRLEGPSVQELFIRFYIDWKSAGNQDIQLSNSILNNGPRIGTGNMVQILSSGPDDRIEHIKFAYIDLINRAEKSISIQSPYFIPDSAFLVAIESALLRGVKVEIMFPDKKDHMFVYWATYSFIGDLLPLGLKAYRYKNGFLHSKTIIVDDEVVSIGSANFDQRSFSLSFETNAIIFNDSIAYKYKRIFNNDIENSEEITLAKYLNRSIIIKLKEPICRLFAPLL